MNTFKFQPSDYWLSVTEAARRSGCSAQAVRMRIRKGRIAALKRYGHWLINTRSLQEYIQHDGIRHLGDSDFWKGQLVGLSSEFDRCGEIG